MSLPIDYRCVVVVVDVVVVPISPPLRRIYVAAVAAVALMKRQCLQPSLFPSNWKSFGWNPSRHSFDFEMFFLFVFIQFCYLRLFCIRKCQLFVIV